MLHRIFRNNLSIIMHFLNVNQHLIVKVYIQYLFYFILGFVTS